MSSREPKVLLKCAAPRFTDGYRKKEILHVVALRNTKVREELLVDYGRKYSFQ